MSVSNCRSKGFTGQKIVGVFYLVYLVWRNWKRFIHERSENVGNFRKLLVWKSNEQVLKVFFSESADVFLISSNRQTLLFSWVWILNLWNFKGLESCQLRAFSSSEVSNSKMEPYLSLHSFFRLLCDIIWDLQSLTISKFKLRKIIRFICLRKW